MDARRSLLAGVLLMMAAVALGAFGAHALRSQFGEQSLAIWNTAVRYQAWHGLGLIGLGLWMEHHGRRRLLHGSALALLSGTLLFSGSLYALLLTGVRELGMITPIGGLSMILGWGMWAASLLRGEQRPAHEQPRRADASVNRSE
jgi:uncharacterized membrane protein YgdD (TMEM256/DUF423 family)